MSINSPKMHAAQTSAHEAADRQLQRAGRMVFMRHVNRIKSMGVHRDINSRYKKYTELDKSFKFKLLHAETIENTEVFVKIKTISGHASSMIGDFHESYISSHIGMHPNVVETKRVFVLRGTHLYIETERCWGDLADYVLKHRPSKETALSILHQVALALAHLKARCIVHCDIKPTNVLVTREFVDGSPKGLVKVCDFDLSRELAFPGAVSEPSAAVNAIIARPPEILLGLRFDYAVDMFAFGVLVCFVLNAYARREPAQLYWPFLNQDKDKEDLQLQMNRLDIVVGPIPARMFAERDEIYRHFPRLSETPGYVGLPPPTTMRRGFATHFAHFMLSPDPFLAEVAPIMQMMLYPEPHKRILVETLLIDPIFKHAENIVK